MLALGELETLNGMTLFVDVLREAIEDRACTNIIRDDYTGFYHVTIDPCRQAATPVYIMLSGWAGANRPEVFRVDAFLAGDLSASFFDGECSVADLVNAIRGVMEGTLVVSNWRTFSTGYLKAGSREITAVSVRYPVIGFVARLWHSLSSSTPISVKKYERWPEKFDPDEDRPPWSLKKGMTMVAELSCPSREMGRK